jgi:hypothetical protein
MDKAKHVLLVKSGVVPADTAPTAIDINKFDKIYKKPMPKQLIAAVAAMVVTTSPGRKKGGVQDVLNAATAVGISPA